MRRFIGFLVIASFVNVPVWADNGGTALPGRPTDSGDLAYGSNAAPTLDFTINVIASCFPVNVRNVPNPLPPTSTVTMNLALTTNVANANGNANIVMDFPAALSMGQANVGTLPVTV